MTSLADVIASFQEALINGESLPTHRSAVVCVDLDEFTTAVDELSTPATSFMAHIFPLVAQELAMTDGYSSEGEGAQAAWMLLVEEALRCYESMGSLTSFEDGLEAYGKFMAYMEGGRSAADYEVRECADEWFANCETTGSLFLQNLSTSAAVNEKLLALMGDQPEEYAAGVRSIYLNLLEY